MNRRGVPKGIEPIEPSTMKDVLNWSQSDYSNWKRDLYGDDALEEFARQKAEDVELKNIQQMEGFDDYMVESYWDGLTQDQRNTIGDDAIGDVIGLKHYMKIMNSNFNEIDPINQNRLKKFILKQHDIEA